MKRHEQLERDKVESLCWGSGLPLGDGSAAFGRVWCLLPRMRCSCVLAHAEMHHASCQDAARAEQGARDGGFRGHVAEC